MSNFNETYFVFFPDNFYAVFLPETGRKIRIWWERKKKLEVSWRRLNIHLRPTMQVDVQTINGHNNNNLKSYDTRIKHKANL